MKHTPKEELILEVLAARYRLGEQLWTFHSKFEKQIESLAAKGLVVPMHGITENTCRAHLTDKGKKAVLMPGYVPPNQR